MYFNRFTQRAKTAIDLGVESAKSFGHKIVGTEHLLLGLLKEKDGIAAKVLNKLGVTEDILENKIIESGNIVYVSKYSEFNFLATKPTVLFEIVFNYSENLFFSSNKSYIIKAPLDTQEMFKWNDNRETAFGNQAIC